MGTAFDGAFALTVAAEGGFSIVRSDPGNWTGGAVGKGLLHGTKYGISAASFPTLDIAALTLEQAQSIYQARYWLAARCDLMPPMLAALVFDAAVNNGVGAAVGFLQYALGAKQDGAFGTVTAGLLARALMRPDAETILAAGVMDARLWLMAGLPAWRANRGWCRRLASIPFQAARLAAFAPDNASPVTAAARAA